ncbi:MULTISPECIES: hypothetical protein [unclassified Microcoleus]
MTAIVGAYTPESTPVRASDHKRSQKNAWIEMNCRSYHGRSIGHDMSWD